MKFNMRLLLIFLFFIGVLLFGAGSSFAISSQRVPLCSELLLGQSEIDKNYQRLGVNLSELPKDRADYLRSIPPILFSPVSPTFEVLEKTDLTQFKNIEPNFNREFNQFASIQHFQILIKFFNQFKSDADYYFVGNGYYIPYLMTKALFAKTPMVHQIKFIAFSRPLSKLAEENPLEFENYFKSLGLGVDPTKKIVVIDSVSVPNTSVSRNHSIIRTSNAIRKYLISKGWNSRLAIDNVISVGMPEFRSEQSYRLTDLAQYQKQISAVNAGDLGTSALPYFDPGIAWNQEPFNISYGDLSHPLYWNGKYKYLDETQMPIGELDLRFEVNREHDQNLKAKIQYRLALAKFYQRIILLGRAYYQDLDFYIDEIARRH